MILHIHSDALYLSKMRARSRVARYFYLGLNQVDGQPILLNRAVYVFGGILKFVVALAARAELGALFINCKEGKVIILVLHKLGHTQPSTIVHCDNQTSVSIANKRIKKQRSRSMEIRFLG